MAFEQTRFTIVVNAAGSGTWRMWNYIPSPGSAEDDMTEPGYFGAMEGHVHAGDMLVVPTAKAVKLMAFGIGDDGIVAVAMSEAQMPDSNMDPMPQVLPMGSQPGGGAEMPDVQDSNEAVSRPAAAHMESNNPPEAAPAPASAPEAG